MIIKYLFQNELYNIRDLFSLFVFQIVFNSFIKVHVTWLISHHHYGCPLWTGGPYLEASHEFSKLSILATGMQAPRRTPH